MLLLLLVIGYWSLGIAYCSLLFGCCFLKNQELAVAYWQSYCLLLIAFWLLFFWQFQNWLLLTGKVIAYCSLVLFAYGLLLLGKLEFIGDLLLFALIVIHYLLLHKPKEMVHETLYT